MARASARQLTAVYVAAAEPRGNLTQATRERNLAHFASGAARVLVAVDIAARGIHVDDLLERVEPLPDARLANRRHALGTASCPHRGSGRYCR